MITLTHVTKKFILHTHQRVFDLKNIFGYLRERRKLDPSESEHVALNDISLHIKKGERIGVIGGNGSGKTTLLNLIAGVSLPTEGKVEITSTPIILEASLGFQMDLTARDNVYLRGLLYGMDVEYIDSIVEDVLEFAELGKYADQPMKYFSAGMIGRVGFSLVRYVQNNIILLDEVLARGDVYFREKTKETIDAWTREGKTILTISHDMKLIEKSCTRCIYLKKGEIVMDGEPEKVIEKYLENLQ